VEENAAEELVQLVDFEEEGGSVRRFQRMKMWRRTLLRSLFSWLILKRRGSVTKFQMMKMWRRTLLRSLFSW
jgi:hypothetical protein